MARKPPSGEGVTSTTAPKTQTRSERPQSGRVTLQDVANIAGVSSMTVSRVINRPESVSKDVLENVRKAISKTGYMPNLLARGLASNRTRLIGAIIPTLHHVLFSGSIQAFNDRLSDSGYQMLLGLSGYPISEDNLVRMFLSRQPDALLLTGTGHSPELRQQLKAANIPLVEGWDLTNKPLDMAVGFSHAEVGKAVANHLWNKGHRHFAVTTVNDIRARLRHDAFVATLEQLGAKNIVHAEGPAPSSIEQGRKQFHQLRDAGFRGGAIFATSDSLAHGAVLEARAMGFGIPDDISVVGFGDLDYAAYTSPSLTSVRIDRAAIGTFAADMIVARLAGKAVDRKIVDVGFTLVERETT